MAAHCSKLQHTAAHCSTLQHTATHCNTMQQLTAQDVVRSNQYSLLHFECHFFNLTSQSVIQFSRSLLQRSVEKRPMRLRLEIKIKWHSNAIGCTTNTAILFLDLRITTHTKTHCSTLQHTTTHCSTLQHAATRCSTLQHTAVHCNNPLLQTSSDSFNTTNIATCCYTRPHATTHCNTSEQLTAHDILRSIQYNTYCTHCNTTQTQKCVPK